MWRSTRRTVVRWLSAALLLALVPFAFVAQQTPPRGDVLKIVVNDVIHPITDEYIGRALEAARENNDRIVLIELSTPGGLVDSTRSIIEKILASEVPVVVWVAPSGARAASAGFFILQSADVAAMAPGTNTGAASPVALGAPPADDDDKKREDDTMKRKMFEDAAAFMRAFVAKRGRNVEAAESAVREAKAFSDQEALEKNLIDLIAASQEELLAKLHGRQVTRFDGTTTTLAVEGAAVRLFEMTLRQQLLAFIMNPNVAFILLTLGMLGLYAEMQNPGLIVPGVLGFIFILLAVFALNILPTRYAALALIVAAFILFALEAQISSHGILGAGGVVTLVLGALLLVDGPIPEMRVHLITALGVAVPFGVITIFLMTLVVRARAKKVVTGEQGLIGEVGVTRSNLSPRGKVFVHGEIWDAVSTQPLAAGEQVVVRGLKDFVLEVEPLPADYDRRRSQVRDRPVIG